jgi:hypothetical protein
MIHCHGCRGLSHLHGGGCWGGYPTKPSGLLWQGDPGPGLCIRSILSAPQITSKHDLPPLSSKDVSPKPQNCNSNQVRVKPRTRRMEGLEQGTHIHHTPTSPSFSDRRSIRASSARKHPGGAKQGNLVLPAQPGVPEREWVQGARQHGVIGTRARVTRAFTLPERIESKHAVATAS